MDRRRNFEIFGSLRGQLISERTNIVATNKFLVANPQARPLLQTTPSRSPNNTEKNKRSPNLSTNGLKRENQDNNGSGKKIKPSLLFSPCRLPLSTIELQEPRSFPSLIPRQCQEHHDHLSVSLCLKRRAKFTQNVVQVFDARPPDHF